jgi:gamma-butyrobetaine dioxygenase
MLLNHVPRRNAHLTAPRTACPEPPPMTDLILLQGGLALVGANGQATPIHPLWLRERCTDPASMDATTGQRLQNPSDLNARPAIESIRQSADGGFHIRFTDGASGAFTLARILAELPEAGDASLPAPTPWSAAIPAPAAFHWPDLKEPRETRRALHAYLTHGYIIISAVPSMPGAVLDVARHFGFPRETNFGTMFDVRSVPGAIDLAYTSLKLDPHTDNPYRHPVPGIQLLHCLTNETEGGISTLVDGLAVAEKLRATAPQAFESLTRTQIRFHYRDDTTNLVALAPIISLDTAGRFAAIHHSPRLDYVPLLPASDLDRFYAARRLLDKMLRAESFERRFRLNNGDLMMFDNQRLLHGRTEFDPQQGLRHLQGCYIDADGPRSLYRVLVRQP